MATGIPLPPLVQRIVLDPSGLRSSTAATTRAMAPVGAAANKAAKAVTSMSTSMNTLSFRAQTTGRLLFKNIGLPLLLIGGLALKTFAKFERSMVKIEALVGISAGAVENFTDKVKEVSRATGRGPQELADAMFFVTSAGLRGAAALEVMEASAKGAAIGLGETSVVADAATSAVNAYGSENLNGAAAVDILTAAVREGKVEATRLTPAIGKAIPVASAMGIEFHEVAAAIAAMTRTGTDARTSAIQLRQIMQSLLDPSRQTTTALKQMGVAEGELADMARRKGLLAVLVKLRDLSKDNAEAFADVFPNVRALAGAMDITGENLDENTQIFAALANAAGDTDESLRKVSDTVQHRMNVAMSDMKVAFTELGEGMVPLVNTFTKIINMLARAFEWAAAHGAVIKLIGGFALLTTAMGLTLIVTGRLAQAMIFIKAATVKATVSMGAATVATTGLGVAMRGLLIASGVGIALLALGGIISMMVGGMGGFGVKADTAAHSARNLRDELRDVRTAGEEVINPIRGLTGALKEFIDTSEQARIVTRFVTEFQQGITDAFGVGQSAGAFQTEEALVTFFFGRGDNPAVRSALRKLIMDLNRDIGYIIDETGARQRSDAFARLFGGTTATGGVVNEAALSEFLEGETEGLVRALQIHGILAAEQMASSRDEINAEIVRSLTEDKGVRIEWQPAGEFSLQKQRPLAEMIANEMFWDPGILEALLAGQRSDWLAQINQYLINEAFEINNGLVLPDPGAHFALGSDTIEQVVLAAVGDTANAAEAIGPFADEMAKALRTGQVGDFVTEWLAFSEAIVSGSMATQEGVATQERAQRDLMVVTRALFENFAEQLNLPPSVFEDAEDFVDLFHNIKEAIGEGGDLTGGGRGNMEEMADAYTAAVGAIAMRNPDLADSAVQILAFNEVLQEWTTTEMDAAADIRAANRDIESSFAELETRFATADAAAKRLSKRFDDLIGRSMGVGEAQDDLNNGLVKMTEAMNENGGSLDAQTATGRENRDLIREQAESAIEFGEAILRAGGTAEEAQSQVEAAFGAIMANARNQGASEAELSNFFQQSGLNPERIALLFADDKDKIAGTFQSTLDSIINTDEMAHFTGSLGSGLGGNVGAGMVMGLEGATPELIRVIRSMITETREAGDDAALTGSPSRLFYFLGTDIAQGVIDGVYDAVPKLESVMKDFVDAAMGQARRRMGAVSGAISAVMDFEAAKIALADAERRHGGVGVDTRIEELTEMKLDRALVDAQRGLRLGQGNLEDLELAVIEAELAIEAFDQRTEAGTEVMQAQLDAAAAGQEVVETATELRIEGEAAVTAFQGLAMAITDGKDDFQDLVNVTSEGDSLFMAMTTPDFRDGVAQVAKDVHDFANDLERASGVPVVTVTGAPDTTAGLFGTTASTLTDAVNSGTSLVPSPGSPLGYNPANFDRPIGGHNFSGNSAQNQANIAVTVIPPAGAMAAGPGMFAVGSISAAIQAGIENGILDSWMPGTAAWNVLWSEHEYTTTDYSPDSPSSYGGRGGETRE